jgi:hypothetical protein
MEFLYGSIPVMGNSSADVSPVADQLKCSNSYVNFNFTDTDFLVLFVQ